MTFSICIPNFNYERYLGETIQSVLGQSYQDFEVLVADNASTDASVDIARGFGDRRIKVRINARNVGFGGNLDKAGAMASGDFMIMLSSDDLMRAEALSTYARFIETVGAERNIVITSSQDVIDQQGKVTGRMFLRSTWTDSDRDAALSEQFGFPVYRASAREMLRRSLQTMKNPFLFCSTAYPRRLYEQVEGYGGGRTINPDKWFHWKLCAEADEVFYLDHHLFAWRWHPQNQTAQQGGTLKYIVDDYLSTIEFDGDALAEVGLTRDDLAAAYAEHLIGLHGLAVLARYGDVARARRILRFGKAVYPRHVARNWRARLLGVVLMFGPLAPAVARLIRFAKNRGRPLPPSPWNPQG
jgi:glycosyltransferase involved in cell wall biosynthesis